MPFALWLCSLDGPNVTQVEQIMALTIHIFFNFLHIPSVLVGTASPTCSVTLVLELQSSLKASAYSLEKKERAVDTLNECATSLP